MWAIEEDEEKDEQHMKALAIRPAIATAMPINTAMSGAAMPRNITPILPCHRMACLWYLWCDGIWHWPVRCTSAWACALAAALHGNWDSVSDCISDGVINDGNFINDNDDIVWS